MKLIRTPFFLLILLVVKGFSQTKPDSVSQDRALNVFLDCGYCDMDYMRSEIPIINYVRDRKEANVDIVASTMSCGNGGNCLTFVFIGQGKFKGQIDTLKANTTSFETDDGIRQKIAQTLKVGLIRYIAQTPAVGKLNISFSKDTNANAGNTSQVTDKWRSWVFTTNLGGNINEQQLTRQLQFMPSIAISKTTLDWKVGMNANIYYQDYTYNIYGQTLNALMRNEFANIYIVRSLGEYFSGGLVSSVSSSTVNNFELQEKTGPAIEYSLFPYRECTHRQIHLLYSVYDVSNTYVDSTIYGKLKQHLGAESLTLYTQYKEKWGSLAAQITGAHYFYDMSKYEVNMNLSLTVSVFEGFSISLNSYANIVHDQIYLPAAGPTENDILLGLQTLASTYQFGTGLQFTYTFGSIYNNVVNARFNTLFPYF